MNSKIAIVFIFSFLVLPLQGFSLSGVEVFSGVLNADLSHREDYETIPFLVAFNFKMKDKIFAGGDLDFVLEPFTNLVLEPQTNIEVGTNFLMKYTYPITPAISSYIKGGVGALYMSQHIEEQGSQYNFTPQLSLGVHYFFREMTALTFEYRYRHLSNASTQHPNKGVDAEMFLGGISFFF
jgi:hypothetical protein